MERDLGLTNCFNRNNANSCIKINKSNKSNTYVINNNYKAQHLDFLLNEPLNLEKKREDNDKGTKRCN